MRKVYLKSMLLLCALIVGSSSVWADEISVTISAYAGSQEWASGTAYTTIAINSDVSATGLSNGNNSKYYSSNESWRHYEGDGGTITIETTSGTLNSVTFTYSSGNSGVLIYDDTEVSSGSSCDVSGETSVTFSVGHSSGSKNGNVQITKIEVDYTPSGGGGGDAPSISASNVNIAYNATSGSILYSLANASGNVTASVTSGDWLSLGDITASAVPFTCSANAGAERTAQVTLSFTGATNKVVTVTQAAAPLTTMDAIFTASASAGSYYVTMNNWVVSGVNGNQAFVTDNNGKGFLVYKSGHGFVVGNILNGTVQASLTRYKGAAEFTSLTSETSGLTVTTGGTVTPQVVAISDLSGVNTGAVVQVKNVTYDSSDQTLNDASSNAIKPYSTLYSGSYSNGQMYNVTGVYLQFDDTKELLPRSSADIVEIHDPALTATLTTAVPSYVQGTPEGSIALGTVTVGGTYLTEDVTVALADGASSKFELYDAGGDEWTSSITLSKGSGTLASTAISIRLKAGQSAGDYEDAINVTSTGATTKNVAVAASVTTLTVTYDANGADSGTAPTDATAYAYNAEVTVLGNTGSMTKDHYTFDGWSTEPDGSGDYYVADETFHITANTTLYAVWTGNTHTVTLPDDDAYGEYTMDVISPVAYGEEVTLTYTPAVGYENYVATWSVNGTPISGNKFNMPDENVTITVSLNEVFEMTLSNSDIVSAGAGADGYGSKTITDGNGKTWNAYAIKNQHSNATSSYHFLQIKAYASSTAYYVQVPEYGRKITKLEMTVSASGKAMDGGGNSATLFFSASNSTSATGTGVASGTGASKVTIDCSSLNLNTGYITASGAVRIWDVKVTYAPIRLNSYGYATYAGSTPINYADDSKFSAWAITSISGDAITFSQITESVPAGTGVLLKGTPDQAVEPIVAASGSAITNMLVGCINPLYVDKEATKWVLVANTFQHLGSYTGNIPAGKAYLSYAGGTGAADRLRIVFEEDNATNIEELKASETAVKFIENSKLLIRKNGIVYDALGRVVR